MTIVSFLIKTFSLNRLIIIIHHCNAVGRDHTVPLEPTDQTCFVVKVYGANKIVVSVKNRRKEHFETQNGSL